MRQAFVSTEIRIGMDLHSGIDFDGKSVLFSTYVVALSRREVNWIASTQNPVITDNCNNGGIAFSSSRIARDTTTT